MDKMAGVAVHEDVIEESCRPRSRTCWPTTWQTTPTKSPNSITWADASGPREIGRLEASLKMPEGKQQTSAPPPPSTLRGGAAPHVALEQVNDMGTFAKRLSERP